ncbi:MAG TPA: class I SAM-dependent methyltransferase [Alphaproteobacteria bacterium]
MAPNVAAMHLLMEGGDLSALERAIAGTQTPEAAERLRQARSFATESAAALVPRLSALLNHNPDLDPADAVQRWAAAFDAAVAAHPDASVALYTLGDPRLTDAASREIAAALEEWGLTGPDRRVLDIGCGIGRMLPALAQGCAIAVGVDVSAGMLAEARRRCAASSNLLLVRSAGRDLAMFADGSFELVLAVDSFPYLHLSDIAEPMFAEAARLLAPGGSLVILNYSYRDDFEVDRRDLDRLADAHGLEVVRRGTRDFVLWDGPSFVLQRPGG